MMWGLFGGAFASSLTLGVLLIRKHNELKRLAESAAQGVDAPGLRVTALRNEMVAFGEQHAEQVARATADSILTFDYGLTPQRIMRLEQALNRLR